MPSLGANLLALFAHRSTTQVQSALGVSVERLSSGVRINRAKDDAAGLGISQELQRQVRSTQVASRNAADAVSMTQVAEGSLQEINSMLQRMKQLSVEGANESLGSDQRKFIADELVQLRDEINAVSTRTQFNGYKLLTGDFSHAVKGEFRAVNQLTSTAKSALESSTIESGRFSTYAASKSQVTFGDITVSGAASGSYQLSNQGADITLTATIDGITSTQTLTLVDGAANGRSQIALSDAEGGVTTLNFYKFGVEIKVVNTEVGSDHNAQQIATKIVAAGSTPNRARLTEQWSDVDGADWASGAGRLTAIITSSGGPLRVTDTSQGTVSVDNYTQYQSTESLRTGLQEMAFSGTADELNATLASLQVNSSDGLGEVTVEIVREGMYTFTNALGVTSYYQKFDLNNVDWDDARDLALASSFNGLRGYLTNITSTEESDFVQEKVNVNGWIGASDYYTYINDAIEARNDRIELGQLDETLNLSGGADFSYADQDAAEGNWYWIDGPEGGLRFMQDNEKNNTVWGGVGDVPVEFENWDPGSSGYQEPNNAGSEHYAYAIGGGRWNDFTIGNDGVDAYIVEYGGYAGVSANTSKTILLGVPGTLNVGSPCRLKR